MFERFNMLLKNTSIVLGIIIILLCVTVAESLYILLSKETSEVVEPTETSLAIENTNNTESDVIQSKIHIDIKGAVKKPGVYELDSNLLINDAIISAGGLSKNAYTDNINLSKNLVDNMVIYIYTKSEFKKLNNKNDINDVCQTQVTEVNECIDQGLSVIKTNDEQKENIVDVTNNNITGEKDEVSNLININTASEETLMTLTGIGQSKAKAIITYRTENGPFTTIDDIKNVSGIGESIFEKIKDSITV